MLTVLFKYVFVEVWVQIGIRQHREFKMENKRMRSKQFISTCLLSVALGGAAMAGDIVIGYAAPSLDGAQAQIQGDELRVSSKSRDDLQEIIALLRGADFPLDLQFVNYR